MNWFNPHHTATKGAVENPAPGEAGSLAIRSLEEVHGSVPVGYQGFWRRLFAFAGPAYMVSVGYMDPGNWAKIGRAHV